MNRLTNDTVVVANACTDIVPGLVSLAVKLIGALAMMFVLDARFAALLIPLGALLILLSLVSEKR
jgi:ATP-binding cassette subfamily B protein